MAVGRQGQPAALPRLAQLFVQHAPLVLLSHLGRDVKQDPLTGHSQARRIQLLGVLHQRCLRLRGELRVELVRQLGQRLFDRPGLVEADRAAGHRCPGGWQGVVERASQPHLAVGGID